MALTVFFFGQLTDITGAQTLAMDHVADTNALNLVLQQRFPSLARAVYRIAVDKEIITQNTALLPDSTITLLPPFSGG